MKKYFAGILMIAVFAIIGGIKFFGNPTTALAVLVCQSSGSSCHCGPQGGPYTNYVNGEQIGSTGTCCNNGLQAGCAAITVGNKNVATTGLTPTLNWTNVSQATSYNVMIATDANFSNVVVDKRNIGGNTFRLNHNEGCWVPSGCGTSPAAHECSWESPCQRSITVGSTAAADMALFTPNTTYYWKVQACNLNGCSGDSQTFSFKTAMTNGVSGVQPVTVAGGKASDDIYSILTSFTTWKNASGVAVSPKQVVPVQNWYSPDLNMQVYPSVSSVDTVNLVNSILSTKMVGVGSGAAGYPNDTCGGTNPPASLSNPHCCGTTYTNSNGGNVVASPYSWGSGACGAISVSGSATYTQ